MFTRSLRFLTLLLMSALGGAAFAQGPRHLPPAPVDEVRIGIGDEPYSLDANLANSVPDSKCLNALSEGLVRLDGNAEPMPGNAVSWDHSADFKTWTFHLRKEAKWSDGAPVTADDFVYAIRRILDPATAAQYAQFVYTKLKGGEEYYKAKPQDPKVLGVRAIDPLTLEFQLACPMPFFPSCLGHTSFHPVPRQAIEKSGANWANKPETWVGCGPFKMAEWQGHDRIICVPNPYFWDAKNVHWKKVIFRPIPDQQTEQAAFDSGELDFTDRVLLTEVPKLKLRPEYKVPKAYLGSYYVLFQVQDPPFNELALRKAFSLAINRKVITERITKRDEPMSEGIVPRGIAGLDGRDFRDVLGNQVGWSGDYKADVAKARKILSDAGYAVPGNKKGKPLPRVEYLYNTSTDHKLIGEALQNMWKTALGAEVKMKNVEFKVRIAMANEHKFQFGRFAWILDYKDPMAMLEIFRTGGGNNDGAYTNPKFDALLDKAQAETDPAKRYELLAQAEHIAIDEDCLAAPIFDYRDPIMVRTDVVGWSRNQLADLDVSRAHRAP